MINYIRQYRKKDDFEALLSDIIRTIHAYIRGQRVPFLKSALPNIWSKNSKVKAVELVELLCSKIYKSCPLSYICQWVPS